MAQTYYAHSLEGEPKERWQTLACHLNNVADLAESFAVDFGLGSCVRAEALLHDAGKASLKFQERLDGAPGIVDHTTAGSLIAKDRYADLGSFLVYMISGHHGGLPNMTRHGRSKSIRERLDDDRVAKEVPQYKGFLELLDSREIVLPEPQMLLKELMPAKKFTSGEDAAHEIFNLSLKLRFAYSCLVDADYLDTEKFMVPEKTAMRPRNYLELGQLLETLEQHMCDLMEKADYSLAVNKARKSIFEDCLAAANLEAGLFKLTVPTGGGKTLSSLAFALKHAISNGQKRIIFAIPYTSVVEQTATVFKRIFGDDAVLEHHSNFNYEELEEEEKLSHILATQNWDAPIVVTTNVQFFESLYSNKPSKNRKLHNIVGSVVILDEAQTLPDHLLKPSLAALEGLASTFNTSIVLCTATQPALETIWPFGSVPREIVRNHDQFDEAFGGRVSFENVGAIEEDDLVERMTSYRQALCIVGTRREAKRVYQAILHHQKEQGVFDAEGIEDRSVFHLSASMVPAHRSAVIAKVRERLDRQEACLVVSTQLIEAGVDIDFPVVFREIAGLDSVMQAAGRCNREGKSRACPVFIFDYCIDGERQKTVKELEDMKQIGRNTLREHRGVLDEDSIAAFFSTRYRNRDTDVHGMVKELTKTSILRTGFGTYEFEDYADSYRFIKEDGETLFIPWGDKGISLLRELLEFENPAVMIGKLQRYTITVPKWQAEQHIKNGYIERHDPVLVLRTDNPGVELYREDIGFLPPGEEKMQTLIC